MLETEKLDDLFRLLKEMSQSKSSDPRLTPPIARRLEKYSLIGSSLSVIVFLIVYLVLVAWQRLGARPYLLDPDVLRWLAVFLLGFVPLFAGLTLIAVQYYRAWFQGKHGVWITLENDLRHDEINCTAANVQQGNTGLWSTPVSLSFVILGKPRRINRWHLRKLGLFPALAALAVSGAVLYKEDSNLFLSVPVTVAAIFYLVTLGASLSLERRQQIILLLEYAIQHTNQFNATPSDANQ